MTAAKDDLTLAGKKSVKIGSSKGPVTVSADTKATVVAGAVIKLAVGDEKAPPCALTLDKDASKIRLTVGTSSKSIVSVEDGVIGIGIKGGDVEGVGIKSGHVVLKSSDKITLKGAQVLCNGKRILLGD